MQQIIFLNDQALMQALKGRELNPNDIIGVLTIITNGPFFACGFEKKKKN